MLKQMRFARVLALALAAGLAGCDKDPITPVDLTAPAGLTTSTTGSSVQLTWSAVPGAESYAVQRQAYGSGQDFSDLASGVTATQYVDATAEPRTTYSYRVLAVRGGVRSEASEASAVRVCAAGVLCGTIPAGDTVRLAAGTYSMQGVVTVDSGAVLEIAAGTTLRADVEVKPTALLVRRGGQIFARGTAQQPIVFTSANPVGQRNRGDWGGVLIAGRSFCSFPAPCEAEGIPTSYGGNSPDDNSGVLSYVRIEFAGFEVSPGNELNALTLYGVGSGTQLDHIQVHMGSDDGVEFFGGTVNLKYAIATGNDDDSFDYSTGWQGKGQFWIVQQSENAGDYGFEVDGNERNFLATPLTDPQVYNVTLIGRGPSGNTKDAILLRRGVKGKIHNAIVMGWGGAVLDVDNQETADHCAGANRLIDDVIYFQAAELFDGDSDAFEAACAGTRFRNVDPQLRAATDRTAPDFRPAAGSPALTGAAAVPGGDGFFTAAGYLGAVDPNGTPWYQGWTTFAVN